MSDTVIEQTIPVVTLTQSALQQVRYLIAKQGNSDLGLRLGVKGGGCSGLSYTMTLEAAPTSRDMVFEMDGIKIIIDRKSANFLYGATLDYSVKNLLEGGWQWSNPNAQRSCGCGTSFTPR